MSRDKKPQIPLPYLWEGPLYHDDPAPDSPERMALIRRLVPLTQAERAAKETPEQHAERERLQDIELDAHVRRQTILKAQDANLGAPWDTSAPFPKQHKALTVTKERWVKVKVGRPLGRVADALKAAEGDRIRRCRLKWKREHQVRPAGFPERQWEACQLVYGDGLPDPEAGRRMGNISGVAVLKLRRKAEKRGIADPRPGWEGG